MEDATLVRGKIDHCAGRPNSGDLIFLLSLWEGSLLEVRRPRTVMQIDKDVPIDTVVPMEQLISASVAERRDLMFLLMTFALLALSLAAIGIYGLLAYTVKQRTNEIGIRVALGARRSDVMKMVIADGLKLTLTGVVIGIFGAVGLTRFLSHLLYGVGPTDPLTLVIVSLALIAVGLLACYIPARRATQVDPMVALRYE